MKIAHFFKNPDSSAGRDTLRRAVRVTRRTTSQAVLSGSARERILDAVRSQAADQPAELFPSLFTAPRRLLAAGALPLLLAVGLLVLLNQPTPVTPDLGASSMQISKEDGQIFIHIANGSRNHVVYRSTVPDRFERSTGVTVTDGSFTDAIDDQAGLVFYRIDECFRNCGFEVSNRQPRKEKREVEAACQANRALTSFEFLVHSTAPRHSRSARCL